jgi:hypothetical protein
VIGPFEKPIDLLRLTLFGSESHEARSYVGKVILLLRNVHTGTNDSVAMTFTFSEYQQPVVYQPMDLSFYVNPGELATAFGMHSEVT